MSEWYLKLRNEETIKAKLQISMFHIDYFLAMVISDFSLNLFHFLWGFMWTNDTLRLVHRGLYSTPTSAYLPNVQYVHFTSYVCNIINSGEFSQLFAKVIIWGRCLFFYFELTDGSPPVVTWLCLGTYSIVVVGGGIFTHSDISLNPFL